MAAPARQLIAVLSTSLLAVALTVGLAGPASAEDGYRYWNYYYEKDGAWEFSTKGAAQRTPKDGATEAYRFGTSTVSQGIEPRADLREVNFEAVCGGEEAAADQKRVAVLIDYGTEGDADNASPPEPRAECAVVDADASGQQVLEAVADLRVEGGLTCAIDGYPARGCGEPVPDAEVPTDEEAVQFAVPASADSETMAAEEDSSSGVSLTLVAVVALVVLIGLAALVLARRRSKV